MASISETQLRALWRAGVYVGRSWETYAHPDLKARWDALKEESAIDAFAKGMEQASTSEAGRFEKFNQAFEGSTAILTKRAALKSELQKNILSYIAKGHLHGFGFELPRSMADMPVAIPKSAWTGRLDWDNSALSYQGIELCAVRLTTNRIRNEILGRGNVDKTPVRPQGRPTVRHAIEAAFYALNEAGKIDPTASQMSHYPLVKGWLELNQPDLPVPPAHMSDKTINKYFSQLFNALKENRNL